jgi:hypothetical protein
VAFQNHLGSPLGVWVGGGVAFSCFSVIRNTEVNITRTESGGHGNAHIRYDINGGLVDVILGGVILFFCANASTDDSFLKMQGGGIIPRL